MARLRSLPRPSPPPPPRRRRACAARNAPSHRPSHTRHWLAGAAGDDPAAADDAAADDDDPSFVQGYFFVIVIALVLFCGCTCLSVNAWQPEHGGAYARLVGYDGSESRPPDEQRVLLRDSLAESGEAAWVRFVCAFENKARAGPEALEQLSVDRLRNASVRVRFAGEAGIDGGVSREWFDVVARELFANGGFGLFVARRESGYACNLDPRSGDARHDAARAALAPAGASRQDRRRRLLRFAGASSPRRSGSA
ncbi:ubiquitin protein ligase [Aureococcus anophagefferens]|nr:ubiquitin protein ligase [Aureococcus anophagefferens]